MSFEKEFGQLAEEYKGVADVGVVSSDKFDDVVTGLSDTELSLNLLPLGQRLAAAGDLKYTTLLAEAGRRLADRAEAKLNQDNVLNLNAKAKATILHSLDRFIADDCQVPEGCSHFDDVDVPSKEQVLSLIELIGQFDGVALYQQGDDENDTESESDDAGIEALNDVVNKLGAALSAGTQFKPSSPFADNSTLEGVNAAIKYATDASPEELFSPKGAKTVIELATGKPLTSQLSAELAEDFRKHLLSKGHSQEEANEASNFILSSLLVENSK